MTKKNAANKAKKIVKLVPYAGNVKTLTGAIPKNVGFPSAKKLLFIGFLLLSFATFAQTKPEKCKGLTAKGIACGSFAIKQTGYCINHNPNSFRCGAITKANKPCKVIVKSSGQKCRFHS